MLKKTLQSDSLLTLTALIWGAAFVAQKLAMEHIGPMTFTGIRFLLGAIVLIPVLLYQRQTNVPKKSSTRYLLLTALLAGIALYAGASLQQIGIVSTTAAKAGFITGIYIAIVPIISIFLGHKVPRSIWVGCAIAFLGLYLLSVKGGEQGGFTIVSGDMFVLASAVFWAIHVQLIGYIVKRVNPWYLAFIQFLTCSILSLITAVFTEQISMQSITDAAMPIFYAGIISVGIGYTLQVLCQQTAPPSHAAIIMSLEMPFAAIAGYLWLNETLSGRGLAGCLLMLAGVISVQLASIRRAKQASQKPEAQAQG